MWVQEMEKILAVLNCTEEQKVLFATFKLAIEVERWWHAMKLWDEQRAYAAKFLKLSRFAPSMVPDEYQKARWFERGLNNRIHEHMTLLKIQNFTMVEKATIVELSLQRGTEASERRKTPASSGSQANVRKRSQRGDRDAAGQGSKRNNWG
ncbi:uncharacterized protein LOC131167481 [Malania oleifera]|uniref:uncharacterized protein LOC131167481 n=1 Tax=Malania oleifera TaxID=397392 RepID=UPI0025ADAAB3|nr:uncharacterized protein LOC131167481 [Malania oleifera]